MRKSSAEIVRGVFDGLTVDDTPEAEERRRRERERRRGSFAGSAIPLALLGAGAGAAGSALAGGASAYFSYPAVEERGELRADAVRRHHQRLGDPPELVDRIHRQEINRRAPGRSEHVWRNALSGESIGKGLALGATLGLGTAGALALRRRHQELNPPEDVEELSEEERRQRLHRRLALGLGVGGAGVAGLGALGMSESILRPQDRQRMEDFHGITGRADQEVEPDRLTQLGRDYNYYGSRASGAKPFGRPVHQVMQPIVQSGLAGRDMTWDEDTRDHYVDYAAGPVRASGRRAQELYPHYLASMEAILEGDAQTEDLPVPRGVEDTQLTTAQRQAVIDQLPELTDQQRQEVLNPHLFPTAYNRLATRLGRDTGLLDRGTPAALAPPEVQRELHQQLDHQKALELDPVDGTRVLLADAAAGAAAPQAVARYRSGTGPVVRGIGALQRHGGKLLAGGATLGAAGLLYYLANRSRSEDDDAEDEPQEKTAAIDPTSPFYPDAEYEAQMRERLLSGNDGPGNIFPRWRDVGAAAGVSLAVPALLASAYHVLRPRTLGERRHTVRWNKHRLSQDVSDDEDDKEGQRKAAADLSVGELTELAGRGVDQAARTNPYATLGGAGAGIGVAGGLLHAYMRGERGEDGEEDRPADWRTYLRRALVGAGVGGAAGLGVGALHKHVLSPESMTPAERSALRLEHEPDRDKWAELYLEHVQDERARRYFKENPDDPNHPVNRIPYMIQRYQEDPELNYGRWSALPRSRAPYDSVRGESEPYFGQEGADGLTLRDLRDLGFFDSAVAVPELGQSRWMTYRHPESNLHLHHHPQNWSYHIDGHPATQVLAERMRRRGANPNTIRNTIRSLVYGLPHAIGEGLPGWLAAGGLWASDSSTLDTEFGILDGTITRDEARGTTYGRPGTIARRLGLLGSIPAAAYVGAKTPGWIGQWRRRKQEQEMEEAEEEERRKERNRRRRERQAARRQQKAAAASVTQQQLSPISATARESESFINPWGSFGDGNTDAAIRYINERENKRFDRERRAEGYLPLMRDIALGATIGGGFGGLKGYLAEGGVGPATTGLAGIGASVGAAAPLLLHLVREATANRTRHRRDKIMRDTPKDVREALKHPEVEDRVIEAEKARLAPLTHAEIGGLAGGLLGTAGTLLAGGGGAAHLGSGIIGGGTGALAGWLHGRRRRQRAGQALQRALRKRLA